MGPDEGAAALELARRRHGRVPAGIGLHRSRVPALAARAADRLATMRGAAAETMGERLAANLERYLRSAV